MFPFRKSSLLTQQHQGLSPFTPGRATNTMAASVMSLPPLDDPSSPALITTDCSNGILRLPNVVTEVDGTTLGSFTVTSRTAQPLLVKLQTSAPNAVTFQLENENLRHAGIGAEDDDPEDWNALFNEVGHISELLLPPHGSTKVVVSFRPKPLIDASDAVEHETSSKNRPFGETTRKRHAVHHAVRRWGCDWAVPAGGLP